MSIIRSTRSMAATVVALPTRLAGAAGRALDVAIGVVAPRLALQRTRARTAMGLVRGYDAAVTSRRTSGWRPSTGDSNAVLGPAISRLRQQARALVENNGYAESALTTICDHVVGWGIVAKTTNKAAHKAWTEWAESSDCSSDGRNNLYGLQHLVMRTVVESGEALIRRRIRRPDEGLPIPLQLQVLEPDYLDTSKFGTVEIRRTDDSAAGYTVVGQNVIVHGIEFDKLGRRRAYWLFREHPGNALGMFTHQSVRIPASEVIHVYDQKRPQAVRGASWFAPVLMKFSDFDEFEDATLLKQKVAACLAVIMTSPDGSMASLGTPDSSTTPETDRIEPGTIIHASPGQEVEVVQPPNVGEYSAYSTVTLRAIATGLGVPYEDLTGDYTGMPFSAARMSRKRHQTRVLGWQWRLLIPQMCEPVWKWAMEAAQIMGDGDITLRPKWTAPPLPMVDPEKEGAAHTRNIRSGLTSRSEAQRELGYDPEAVLAEIASDNAKADALGIILDSDPRKTTQAGLSQTFRDTDTEFPDEAEEPKPGEKPDDTEGDEGEEEDDEQA